MKRSNYILTNLFLIVTFLGSIMTQAQLSKEDCTLEYNLYKGDVKAKNFTEAKTRLDNLMENCPDLTVNIYKYAEKVVNDIIAKGDKEGGLELMSKVYDQRLQYYPDDAAKVYSDWVSFLLKNGISQDDERVFDYLDKAYKADPSDMSAKNVYMYFDIVLERNKNTDVQKILDTYDDINDALDTKAEKYQKRLSKLIAKEEGGATLSKKEAKSKRIAEGTLKNIGTVKGGLDQKIEELLTCDRLIPLYKKDFDENKDNKQWLQRAVSRMYTKECTSDPLYEQLAEAYAKADPSSSSYIFLSNILEDKGKSSQALAMRKKAIDLENDPVKKSKYLLQVARGLSKKGQYSSARTYANKAIQFNPSNGSAYLLIGSMYAKSANKCGDNEFAKRMVYVAALNKARRAAKVDPSIAGHAKKFISSYSQNIPTKTMVFTEGVKVGDSYTIGCWIGETVKVEARN